MPKEETFPIPLKYIDVNRSTHTDLDIMQEKKIDDYWNVDSSKHLSDSWRRCTKIHSIERKTSRMEINVVLEETDRDSNDHQTRLCMARSLDENW